MSGIARAFRGVTKGVIDAMKAACSTSSPMATLWLLRDTRDKQNYQKPEYIAAQ